MTNEIDHKELKQIVKEFYKKKLALFVWGTFGVGKSRVILDGAKEIADSRSREFCEWNKLNKKEKLNVFAYPEKYFLYVDIRGSEMDSSDIKGLPKFLDNSDMIDWKIPMWAKLMTLPNSDGILAFEELNLSTPLVMSSFYKIIYNRFIGEEAIEKSWLVLGCGNLETDMAFVHSLPEPLKDRAGECILKVPDCESWINDFAIPNGIDSRIIGYINCKKESLHKVDFKDNQKNCTPRGWERLSKLIKGVKNYNTISLLSNCAIGKGVAIEFVAFCRIQENMKIEDVIKHPEKIKNIKTPDVKYFLISAVAEKYGDKKDKQVDFDKVIAVSKVLDEMGNAEFVALLWRMTVSYAPEMFKKDFLNSKGIEDFVNRYGKFIV